ncbi:MAG: HU family DNA-binding protein [Bacteroidales bacterium]|nr:HU family DNA-binding protein [Bacteroidales bacterium]MDD4684896.1 HU family DNA-binding protein [Bacteroidales bacterium]
MTKKDFIHLMSAKADLNLKQTGAAYEAFLNVLEEQLMQGERVSFIGFGSFTVVDKDARTARNPRTGKAIKVAAKRVVKFKPGSGLKDMKKAKK